MSTGRKLWEGYEVGQDADNRQFAGMVCDFAQGLTADWGWNNLQELAVLPTRYLDSRRAFALLMVGAKETFIIDEPTVVPSIYVPMLREDGDWKVHLPGFAWRERPELVRTEAKTMT